jgi:H+/Cl- antiporter ClcA
MDDTHIQSDPPKPKESWVPTQKTTGGAFGGALAVVLIWVLKVTTQVEMPPEIAAAFGVIVTSAVAYLIPARS